VQIYAALAADRLAFNSAFNRDSFLDGTDALLARMPDGVPGDLRQRLAERSTVLPIPITPPAAPAAKRDPGLILWSHRWEYDKAPEVFARAVLELAERGIDFRLALLGNRAEPAPEPLQWLRDHLGDRIVADGKPPRAEYEAWLGRSAIAVSSALHEFQGLAMLEATAAGATPLVPDALAYREQYPEACRYPPGDLAALADRLADWLTHDLPAAPDVTAWTPGRLLPAWRWALNDLLVVN
jgi:glycosyltransferase involved in cell wall biosynthesis